MSERLAELKARAEELESRQNYWDTVPLVSEIAELTGLEYGEDSQEYVDALNQLGCLYRGLGEQDKAIEELTKAVEIESATRGVETLDYATSITNLAGAYRLRGEFERAESLFLEAKEIFTEGLGKEHFHYLSAANNLGLVYSDLKRYDEAERLHREVLAVQVKSGKRDAIYANTINNLSAVLMATGRPQEAIQYLEEALQIYETSTGVASVLYATGLNNLAAAHYQAGDYAEAEQYFSQALPIIEKDLGRDHPSWNSTNRNRKVAAMSNVDNSELTKAIVDREWEMFTNTQSIDGRSSCQDDEPSFRVNRLAQIADWPPALLESYLDDLKVAGEGERNLVSEKYGHMMKWTSPAEYQSIAHLLPQPDSESLALIDEIVDQVTAWEEETRAKYPNIAMRSRPLYASDDAPGGPSVQTYLRGELMTYSPKTIQLYHQDVTSQKAANINGAERILANIMKLSNGRTLDEVEVALSGAQQ